ncbi:MAG: electron transfer flavoprotein subunit beta/FixA family protein [Hespellia sp.]|nr:electron transfer flavoprotein subunit beta/FixA family protein [Hespellia sp.]
MDQISEEEWASDPANRIDTSYVKKILSCYDESGLEMMLKFSDESGDFGVPVQLDAVTIGRKMNENYLKTLYALGFTEATRIECEKEIQFWPEWTAGILSEFMNQTERYDLVVMGNRSADEENGKVPFLLAEELGWPCISQVVEIIPEDEAHVKVRYEVDNGYCTSVVQLPCILSIGDVPCSFLRVPTLKDRMQKGKKEIHRVKIEDLGISETFEGLQPDLSLVNLEVIDQSRPGVILDGMNAEEKAEKLYQTYLKGRVEL